MPYMHAASTVWSVVEQQIEWQAEFLAPAGLVSAGAGAGTEGDQSMGDPSRRDGLLPPGVLRWPFLRAADLRPDVAALLGTLHGAGVALAPAPNVICHPHDTQSALLGCLQAAVHDSLHIAGKRLTQDTSTSSRQEQPDMYVNGSRWGRVQAAQCPSKLRLPY